MIALTIIGFVLMGALIWGCAMASHNSEERQRRADLLKKGGSIK